MDVKVLKLKSALRVRFPANCLMKVSRNIRQYTRFSGIIRPNKIIELRKRRNSLRLSSDPAKVRECDAMEVYVVCHPSITIKSVRAIVVACGQHVARNAAVAQVVEARAPARGRACGACDRHPDRQSSAKLRQVANGLEGGRLPPLAPLGRLD